MNELNGVWSTSDIWGALKVRLGINRGNYRVEPGLYGMNNPGRVSPVFVTANYKLTVDILRRELVGLDCHILVLDTGGINVWCAAGKGTFGTAELVRRIEMTGLASRLDHRVLILPQLGAPGVSARDVRKETGFRVIFGPVEARDIPEFLAGGMKKTARMRTKSFSWRDRLVLTPLELIQSWKILLPFALLVLIMNGFCSGWNQLNFSLLVPLLLGAITGGFLTPLLLPLPPIRVLSKR